MHAISDRARAAAAEFEPVRAFFEARHGVESPPGACDFTFGNPHEMPLAGLVAAIKDNADPHSVDWFAYKASETRPREAIAAALTRELGLPFTPEDIAMTTGAFGAIALAFRLVGAAGDEAVIPTPGWFCYRPMLRAADMVPVRAPLDPEDFDLDLAAIEAAITPRTRLVVVNTPNNPTGRIYSRARLEELARLLDVASARIGARIFLLSDEPYRRIRFDGAAFTSPAAVYPYTLIDYSYGKVLLAPGQRLGYLAISPLMPSETRAELQSGLFPTQMALGWTFPDAVMQYSVPALEELSIDLAALAAKRDRFLGALERWGYQMTRPEGTFYLWGAAPGGDAAGLAARLAARDVHIMPGTLFERPGDFRLCLTARMESIERALPAFRDVAEELRS